MNQYYQQFEALYNSLEDVAPEMHPSDIDCAAKCLTREQITSKFCRKMQNAGLFEAADCEAIASSVARCEREQKAISAVVAPQRHNQPQPATTSHEPTGA